MKKGTLVKTSLSYNHSIANSNDPIILKGRIEEVCKGQWDGWFGIRVIKGYIKKTKKTIKGEKYFFTWGNIAEFASEENLC